MSAPAVQPIQAEITKRVGGVPKKLNGHGLSSTSSSVNVTDGAANGSNGYHESSSGSVDGGSLTRSSIMYGGGAQKTSILRERTIRISQTIQTRFGGSSGVFLDSTNSFDDFLDAIADQRLRFMPHNGNKWDKVLRLAEGFATYIYAFHHAVHGFMLQSEDASRMIWSSVLALLQMGPTHINTLTRVFSVFHRLGLSISLLLRQEHLLTATAEIRRELAHAYSDLMELACAVSMYYLTKSDLQLDGDDFNEQFDGLIKAFYSHRDEVADSLWALHMRGLSGGEAISFHDIRCFLEPGDQTTCRILTARSSFGTERAEFTCEWFAPHLNDFTIRKNKMLLVTGPAGCGKTMLSDWIVESLRGTMEHTPYDVICYRVWSDVPETTSSLTLVKSLVLQAVNRNIGNETLVSRVRQAMKMASSGSTAEAVEKVLWQALEHVATHSKLMIIVDGLDQLNSDHHAVLEHLHSATAQEKNNSSKAIVLSRPLQKPAPSKTQHLSVSETAVLADIKLFVQFRMEQHEQLAGMGPRDKKEIAQKIADRSQGSFLWAECAFQCLRHEHTPQGFMQWLARAPKTVDEFVDHHVAGLRLDKAETVPVLSWVLAAERPLTVTEIGLLLELDTKKGSTATRHGDVAETVRHALGAVVTIADGAVCLKHPSMRHHLSACQRDKFRFDAKKAQTSLALRLLAYVRLHVADELDVSWAPVRMYEARTYFDRHALLEYSARYWVSHFRASRYYNADKRTADVDARLKLCWPKSTLLAVLEGACFRWGPVGVEVEAAQRVAYEVRRQLLGKDSAATLQSLLFVVQLQHARTSTDLTALAYEAWRASRSAHTHVALECGKAFVAATASLAVAKRTEVVTWKEEVLQYLVATYKRTGGVSHELTVTYTRALAELYVAVKETDKAVVLYRELYDVSIERHGYFHEQTTAVYEVLVAQLRALKRFDTVLELVQAYHDYVCRTLSIGDERRVRSTMKLVHMYEEHSETAKAEAALVDYWKAVMASARASSGSAASSTASVSSTRSASAASIETKIDVALEYSRFLRRHSRTEEAQVVMSGVYKEVEMHGETASSTSVLTRVKSIAEEFQSLKVFSMARSIYSSLWSSTRKTSAASSFSEEVATALAETVTEEISTKTAQMTSAAELSSFESSTVLTAEEEATLREVFESSLAMATAKTAAASVVKTGVALSSSYYKQERYQEAASTYAQVLSRTWASVESAEATSEVEQSEEMIDVAMKLAECHFQMLHIEKSQATYRNVFRALLRSKTMSHASLVGRARDIIEYHKRIYRFDKTIEYYHEICVHLKGRIQGGASEAVDILTVELFADYGALARKLGKHREGIEAYYYIHLAYKLDDGCVAQHGIAPSLTLCELYEEEGSWVEARTTYSVLWQTFIKHGKQYATSRTLIERVFERYLHLLEHKVEVKKEKRDEHYEAVRKLAVEYRDTCVRFFGEKHELAVKATMYLAEICERSDKHREQAVTLYEEALKNSSETNIRTTTVTTAHGSTSRSSSASSASSSSSSTSSETMTTSVSSLARKKLASMYSTKETSSTRAVSLHEEQLGLTRTEYGASSAESMSAMRELVATYKKLNTSESTSKAVATLRSSALEVFRSETHSERIVEASRTLARTYVECGFKSEAQSLVKELRSSVIEDVRKKTTSTATTASTKTTSSESSLSVFLAAFEEVVSGKSFSAAMADIRAEIFLYQSYFEAVSSTTAVHLTTILERGVRLRLFLLESKRTEEAKRIEAELFAVFTKHINGVTTSVAISGAIAAKTITSTIMETFFSICLNHMAEDDSQTVIIERCVQTVREYANGAMFAEAFGMAALLHRYTTLQGGFTSKQIIHAISRLCLYLVGRGTTKSCKDTNDTALYGAMLDLSRAMLREALEACTTLNISLVDMDVGELNEIIIVLGEQQNYEDLERVLTSLWSSRTVQRTWSSPLVIAIGRRLIETRVLRGRLDDAIRLCEDIRYNLTRVWGALDSSTLAFTLLLSELYSSRSRYADALALHEDALSRLASTRVGGGGEDGECEHEGSDDGLTDKNEGARAAVAQLEYAQRAVARAGGWAADSTSAAYRDLYADLAARYAKARAWEERRPQPADKWPAKLADAKDALGLWCAPETFSLMVGGVAAGGVKTGAGGRLEGVSVGLEGSGNGVGAERKKRASALRRVSDRMASHGGHHHHGHRSASGGSGVGGWANWQSGGAVVRVL